MKRVSLLLCHRLLQMLWPMLMWVIESERDQLWFDHLLGSLTFKPAGNIFIYSWFFYFIASPMRLFVRSEVLQRKKHTIKHPGRQIKFNEATFFFFFLLIMLFKISCFINRISHLFYRIESKLCTFIPDLFNGWIVPKTYTGKLKSLPLLSDIYGCDRSP